MRHPFARVYLNSSQCSIVVYCHQIFCEMIYLVQDEQGFSLKNTICSMFVIIFFFDYHVQTKLQRRFSIFFFLIIKNARDLEQICGQQYLVYKIHTVWFFFSSNALLSISIHNFAIFVSISVVIKR